MIKRYWKVYCDYCGNLLAEFDHKPTRDELESKNLFTTATKVFCSTQCHGDWNHDLQQTRYLNLKQNGVIHERKTYKTLKIYG